MREFRARDADRDRFVELIEAAYVDGQLGAEDRELRVSRALSAETLDELETLTRDLQRPPGFTAPVAVTGAPPRRAGLVIALVVILVLFMGAAVAMVVLTTASAPVSSTDEGIVEVTQAPTETPVATGPEVEPFSMTASQVRRFVRRYEKKFGTLDAYDITFRPDEVDVEVPVRGSRPRSEGWSWTGQWTRSSAPAAVATTSAGLFDLGGLRPDLVVANVRAAERGLNVQRGRFTHASSWWLFGRPTMHFYVSNTFEEGGHMRTSWSGDVIEARFPYGG